MALSDGAKIGLVVFGVLALGGVVYLATKSNDPPPQSGAGGFEPYAPPPPAPRDDSTGRAVADALTGAFGLAGRVVDNIGQRDRQRADLAAAEQERQERAAVRRDHIAFCRAHPTHAECTNDVRSALGPTAQRSALA